jgi:ACS family hexuronate transporter-like MFS transporter
MGTTLSTNPEERLSKMRWVMVGFAFLATVLNYVHRLSFNYLSATGDLRELIPDKAFGYIGTAFFLAYMISNAFSGFVIDRLGTRIGYSLCMLFWNTAGLFHAFAKTPFQFGAVRFLLGIGEAGNWPAGLKLTTEWFPPRERSTASGIFNTGSAFGSIIVPPLVAYTAIAYGWRETFIILAAFGYLWLIAFWFVYYTPGGSVKKEKPKLIPATMLFKTRFVSMFTLSKFFLDPIWYFVTFWIGRYLVDVQHLTLEQIGWYAMLPFIIADVGNLVGGYFTQWIIKRGVPIPSARRIALALSITLMAVPLLAAPFIIHSSMAALIVFGVVGFGYTSYTANSLALPPDVVPKTSAASVWGLGCIGTGLGGALFQGLSGYTIAEISSAHTYRLAYNYLFVGYGAIAVVGLVIICFFIGPFTRNLKLQAYVEGARKSAEFSSTSPTS